MIRYKTPRKTPDLYSDELFSEIYTAFKPKSHADEEVFKECLERAAESFLRNKSDNNKRFTEKRQEEEFQKLSNYLRKAKEKYLETTNSAQMGSFRFMSALGSLKPSTKKHEEHKRLLFSIVQDGYFQYPENIGVLLEVLEQAALETKNQDYIFAKKDKTSLVLVWLWKFSDVWDEYSSITLSEGRYEEGKYRSKAMEILEAIIAPINAKLDGKDKITNSQIAEAIITYREKKKTEMPFDPLDYFQEL